MSGQFNARDFDDDYKVDMVQAYPDISQTPNRGSKHFYFSYEQLQECFARILGAENLAPVHRLYLDEKSGA